MTDHKQLAVGYFNQAWELIDLTERSSEQDRDMVGIAMASRQHWLEADGTDTNLAISDWQVAYAASLAGFSEIALSFARAAVERAESCDLPTWLQASTHEGLARAHAAAGDRVGYQREAETTRRLLDAVDGDEDRELVASQLASIPAPE